MRTWSKLAIAALLALGLPDASAQTVAFKVVVNAGNPVSSLSREQVSRLFLKKAVTWDNGQPAVPVDLPEASTTREAFSKEVHGRAVRSVKSYWLNQVFTGRLVPPSELPSDQEVLAFVKANPGAIGYVSADAPVRGVKVIEVSAAG
jgi:ABC-type phosphate transport system substrate-binding protein